MKKKSDKRVAAVLGGLVGEGARGPFHREGPKLYDEAMAQNAPFAKSGPYNTQLNPQQEALFRAWVRRNQVPFDPNAQVSDYDMRGFFQRTGGQGWQPGEHFPDTFKTPYDTSFSAESKYATPDNPFVWVGENLVDRRTGRVIFTVGK